MTSKPIWEPKEQMDTWELFRIRVEKFEASQVPMPLDMKLDNIERQVLREKF